MGRNLIMSLPKPNTPTYQETIPSTKKKVMIRPFLVKEEKILLMANEGDYEDRINALKTVINNCCEDVNVEELTIFDFEWLFLKLRSVSVGQNMNIQIKAQEQEEPIDIVIDLADAKVVYPEGHEKNIKLKNFDGYGITMKYPTVAQLATLQTQGHVAEIGSEIIMKCIDKVYSDENVDNFHDYVEKERQEFIDNLSNSDMTAIDKFFKTMPYVELNVNYKDGDTEKSLNIRGLDGFF